MSLIVTLDDLILSGAVDIDMAGDIIDAELAEPAPAKPADVPHPVENPHEDRDARREARAERKLREFAARLQTTLSLPDSERALTAFLVVAQGLVRRLTPGEAADFVAQLPTGIKDRLSELPTGPDRSITLEALDREMAKRMNVDDETATQLVRQVAKALHEFVSAAELEQVIGQLPAEMKAAFAPPT